MYYVYILKSLKNSKSYVGVTSREVNIRLKEHNLGSNKWTNQNGPFILKYYESFYCKEDAVHREFFYKSGIGKQLKKLIVESFTTGSSSVG